MLQRAAGGLTGASGRPWGQAPALQSRHSIRASCQPLHYSKADTDTGVPLSAMAVKIGGFGGLGASPRQYTYAYVPTAATTSGAATAARCRAKQAPLAAGVSLPLACRRARMNRKERSKALGSGVMVWGAEEAKSHTKLPALHMHFSLTQERQTSQHTMQLWNRERMFAVWAKF